MTIPTLSIKDVPTATAATMRLADRAALDRFGIEPIQLMEAAGMQTARFVDAFVDGIRGRSVTVVCGPGNNGGDGMVAARHLCQRGARLKAFVIAPRRPESLVAQHLRTLRSLGIECRDATASAIDLAADIVLDALLGTGLRLPLRASEASVVEAINRQGSPVIAVDVPSGLDADTGEGARSCVRAAATLTLGLPKPGLFGSHVVGRLFLADIGLPAPVFPVRQKAVAAAYARGDVTELV